MPSIAFILTIHCLDNYITDAECPLLAEDCCWLLQSGGPFRVGRSLLPLIYERRLSGKQAFIFLTRTSLNGGGFNRSMFAKSSA